MKIDTTIKFYEGYIPPKCRKTRYKEVFESVWVNIQETTFDSLKLAFIDYYNEWEVYYYNGKLYKQKQFNRTLAYDDEVDNALDDLIMWRKKGSKYYAKPKNTNGDIFNYVEIATNRRDTNYIDIIKKPKIDIKILELFR
jgi:hypothetical protein